MQKKNDLNLVSLELQKEVAILQHHLESLKEQIAILQNGDESGLFWNGENALKATKSLLGHYDHDIVLLENIQRCSEYLESVIK